MEISGGDCCEMQEVYLWTLSQITELSVLQIMEKYLGVGFESSSSK